MKKTLTTCAALLLCFLLIAGCMEARAAAYLTTTVINLNAAPVAENLEITTYRGVEIGGNFRSLDPEGDMVTYSVTEKPKKGEVAVDGDSFVYTPADGKKGKDEFRYVAIDAFGNISNEAAVTVNIKKQASKVTYSDMTGNRAHYAAVFLAENDIFLGEKVGAEYVFNPDATVTRGEFLAMCLELCGAEAVSGISHTGFYDDADIPVWQKGYVAAALVNNVVRGYSDNSGKIVFSPNDPVTKAQATVMLNNALKITDVANFESDAYPVWASQAAANLVSCNIITGSDVSASEVTREDAAIMLLNAADVLAERGENASLLSWAKK